MFFVPQTSNVGSRPNYRAARLIGHTGRINEKVIPTIAEAYEESISVKEIMKEY